MKKTEKKYLAHHAYCLIGNDSIHQELIQILSNEFSIKTKGNPDFFDKKYETFTIDNAREIKLLHSMKPISDLGKIISILKMNGITVEAQNALLKLLEEPNDDSHFFIIIPSGHLLLPTIKSRIFMTDLDEIIGKKKEKIKSVNNDSINSEIEKFLIMSVNERLTFLKKLVDDIKSEKKIKQHAIDFLDEVELAVYRNNKVKNSIKSLESIELARNYIHDRSPSVKMLLEYVALNI